MRNPNCRQGVFSCNRNFELRPLDPFTTQYRIFRYRKLASEAMLRAAQASEARTRNQLLSMAFGWQKWATELEKATLGDSCSK